MPNSPPERRKSKEIANVPSPFEEMGQRFQQFSERFATHFRRGTRSVASQAQKYLQGLMQASRKNMERMEEVVPDCDYQSLHHFVSESEWEARAVLDQVAVEADRHLGGSADSALLIDRAPSRKKATCPWEWHGNGRVVWGRWTTAKWRCLPAWFKGRIRP